MVAGAATMVRKAEHSNLERDRETERQRPLDSGEFVRRLHWNVGLPTVTNNNFLCLAMMVLSPLLAKRWQRLANNQSRFKFVTARISPCMVLVFLPRISRKMLHRLAATDGRPRRWQHPAGDCEQPTQATMRGEEGALHCCRPGKGSSNAQLCRNASSR
eukprot:COSAG01_NODE_13460_length_1583_cov_1.254043_1_plen_159_part_00